MKHISLTNREGRKILVHPDTIKEVFSTPDGEHSVVILNIKRHEDRDTVVLVRESVDEIEADLRSLD